MNDKKYYISTAIAYASSKPHIGNTYEIVLADVIARYKRLCGYDVYFQTGTDEHGQKIEEKALAEGMTPQEYVDEKTSVIKSIWDIMNTSYDRFVRTTDPMHKEMVQKIFKKLYDQGDIYLGEYKGLYCTPCESFWTESQLVDGKCPDCMRDVHLIKEEAYFLRLSKYQDKFKTFVKKTAKRLILPGYITFAILHPVYSLTQIKIALYAIGRPITKWGIDRMAWGLWFYFCLFILKIMVKYSWRNKND